MAFRRNFTEGCCVSRVMSFELLACFEDAPAILAFTVTEMRRAVSGKVPGGDEWMGVELWPSGDYMEATGIEITLVSSALGPVRASATSPQPHGPASPGANAPTESSDPPLS